MFPLPDHLAADEVALLAVPDHLRAAHPAKGAERRDEINGFENIGLALGIVAQQQVKPGRKIHIQPRVIAEVPKAQMGQMHALRMACDGLAGESFWLILRARVNRSQIGEPAALGSPLSADCRRPPSKSGPSTGKRLNSRASCPRFRPSTSRPSRGPHRSLAVASP